jgi:hypothetical protein
MKSIKTYFTPEEIVKILERELRKNEYHRKYQQENRDKDKYYLNREYFANYYEKHKERLKALNRENYRKRQEALGKQVKVRVK